MAKLEDVLKNSIEMNSAKIQLKNDSDTPGNSKYYGTNASGVKGFFNLPESELGAHDHDGDYAPLEHNHDNHVSELPLPSVEYRGKFFLLLGGVEVADKLYVCIKNELDEYIWQIIDLFVEGS
jgi:hypothetical protein